MLVVLMYPLHPEEVSFLGRIFGSALSPPEDRFFILPELFRGIFALICIRSVSFPRLQALKGTITSLIEPQPAWSV